MKIGIIGATGITGSEVLKLLSNQKVAAFVRTPSKLSSISNLEVTQGDVEDTAKLKAWANNLDVVIVAIGHTIGWGQISANLGFSKFAKEHLLSNAIEALIQSNVKRIVYLSAYGTRETRSKLPFIFGKIFMPILIKHAFLDHDRAESLLEASNKEWVVARPGMLTNKPGTGHYLAEKELGAGAKGVIARADVADFMVKAAIQNAYTNQMVALSY